MELARCRKAMRAFFLQISSCALQNDFLTVLVHYHAQKKSITLGEEAGEDRETRIVIVAGFFSPFVLPDQKSARTCAKSHNVRKRTDQAGNNA
ncbi:MAG TPA: hypothetical protein VK832_11490 [Burkholderiaceae bacterium]|nr:hypothetical protein [Burkholderiaceae bacterium]